MIFDRFFCNQIFRLNYCLLNCTIKCYYFQVVSKAFIVRKGIHSHIESYSAFWDYAKTNETALREYLKARKITDVYVCGIAIDICIGKYKQ